MKFDHELAKLAKQAFDQKHSQERWTLLQENLAAWQGRTYGYQPAHRFILGIAEEFLWELSETSDHEDAISDACIYTIQLATAWRLDVGVLINHNVFPNNRRIPARAWLGAVCQVQLKHEQQIRGCADEHEARAAMAWALSHFFTEMIIEHAGGDVNYFYTYVTSTASTVMTRTKQLPTLNS